MWSQREIFEFSDLVTTLNHYRGACIKQLEKFSTTGYRTEEEISQIRQAINSNADLFEYMARKAPAAFGNGPIPQFPMTRPIEEFDTTDLHQLSSALKSASRDWTSLGEIERQQTYSPIISALKDFLPQDSKILIPGAGLCRLAVEIASAGYIACANENAFIMLVISHIAFRHKKEFRIFPFIHQISGLESFNDSLISEVFPRYPVQNISPNGEIDGEIENAVIDPLFLIEHQRLVLMAGDIDGMQNSQQNQFDGVVTCFFIDVVPDVRNLLDLISKVLKPGGYWINLGPLMMHRADDDFFAKASFNDIPRIAQNAGLTIIRESRIETSYIENPNTNIKTNYRCQFLVAQK
ncbi:hypothetical protein TRFO_02085 [Tritrichomonas foetus]|uniref:carnosine N-methyltransferase n=1 Tax=Tritrichomonas foetus TaxID=1144522 RepID=A0A1J4JF73_9EUKA|nr:hypothetical protein TRFO_02085 [Tritrichomonas foetus]|eukprot:OHS96943.1 hypothetical protein TRFO_02085 [Tritrichomonas foetus]